MKLDGKYREGQFISVFNHLGKRFFYFDGGAFLIGYF